MNLVWSSIVQEEQSMIDVLCKLYFLVSIPIKFQACPISYDGHGLLVTYSCLRTATRTRLTRL